jgi:hypothetical protein
MDQNRLLQAHHVRLETTSSGGDARAQRKRDLRLLNLGCNLANEIFCAPRR